MRISSHLAALAALASVGTCLSAEPMAPAQEGPGKNTHRRYGGKIYRVPVGGGEQECARRRAQIERGQLTTSNGLDLSQHYAEEDMRPV